MSEVENFITVLAVRPVPVPSLYPPISKISSLPALAFDTSLKIKESDVGKILYIDIAIAWLFYLGCRQLDILLQKYRDLKKDILYCRE